MGQHLLVPLAAIALAACSDGTDSLPPESPVPGYAVGGGAFDTGTRLTVTAEAFQEAGKTIVCAAWAADDVTAETQPYLDDALATGILRLGGDEILAGFQDFPRAPSRDTLADTPASCVLTAKRWQPRYSGQRPEVDFGRLALKGQSGAGAATVSFTGDV